MPFVMNDDFELVEVPEATAVSSSTARVTPDVVPVAVVANFDQLKDAKKAYESKGLVMEIPTATATALATVRSPAFMESFRVKDLDPGIVMKGLGDMFAKYKTPFGLINPLIMELPKYSYHVVLDDSGSMNSGTDSQRAQAGDYMKSFYNKNGVNLSTQRTRWEEQEDRLHIMLDFLSLLPTKTIVISFLNRVDRIVLTHEGKTPEKFAEESHAKLRTACISPPTPYDLTPTMTKMQEVFNSAYGPTMVYLFTDGEPSDCKTHELAAYLAARKNPELTPLTFMSCTNDDGAANWMKEIEETGPNMAELDDFNDERDEVFNDQGPGFAFTEGHYWGCVLAGAINKDLDAMDDSRPFTKHTMDNFAGRVWTMQEYKHYWDHQPVHELFDFNVFSTAKQSTHEVYGELSEKAQEVINKFRKAQPWEKDKSKKEAIATLAALETGRLAASTNPTESKPAARKSFASSFAAKLKF